MAALFSINERVTPSTDGSLSWLEAGRGTALVLLHGIGSSARSWSAQLEGLSDAYRVIAWNAPGYGASSAPAAISPGVEDYTGKLAELLAALKITRCHLVGHSLGALVAANFAADHSDSVKTLTLASCALGHARLPSDEREKLLRGRLDDIAALGVAGMAQKRAPRLLGPSANAEHVDAVARNMAALDPCGYARAARMLSRGDLLADIARLAPATPLQIVFGTADVVTPPSVNARAAQVRPGTPTATIAGAGHALYVEAPEAFNQILRTFIGARDG